MKSFVTGKTKQTEKQTRKIFNAIN